MSEEIRLSLVTVAISPCDGEMVEWTHITFAISPCDGEKGGMIKESIHSHIICVTFSITFVLFQFFHDSADCLSDFLIGKCFIVAIILID